MAAEGPRDAMAVEPHGGRDDQTELATALGGSTAQVAAPPDVTNETLPSAEDMGGGLHTTLYLCFLVFPLCFQTGTGNTVFPSRKRFRFVFPCCRIVTKLVTYLICAKPKCSYRHLDLE